MTEPPTSNAAKATAAGIGAAVILLAGCLNPWTVGRAINGMDKPKPQETTVKHLTWIGSTDKGAWLEPIILQSTDGHWQIEPQSTSGQGSPGVKPNGSGWCLVDLFDQQHGYLACGTIEQMKRKAETEEQR